MFFFNFTFLYSTVLYVIILIVTVTVLQYLMSCDVLQSLADGEKEEEWETVTMEREQWAQLCDHLELLTKPALVTGANSYKTMIF